MNETTGQSILKVLRNIHTDVHGILSIVSNPPTPTPNPDDRVIQAAITNLKKSSDNLQSALNKAGAKSTNKKG